MQDKPFGGCPECGGDDGYRNVYKHHFFLCHEHQTVWLAGFNLFSSWHDEGDGDWAINLEYLADYGFYNGGRIVGPLSEHVTFEELVPPLTVGDAAEDFLRGLD